MEVHQGWHEELGRESSFEFAKFEQGNSFLLNKGQTRTGGSLQIITFSQSGKFHSKIVLELSCSCFLLGVISTHLPLMRSN